MTTKSERLKIHDWDGVAVLDLVAIEIWDGADLALLRDTLSRIIEREKRRSIGVNMRYVKYIPSGFFGMLYDLQERGIAVRLFQPQPNVQVMLWFRQFCEHEADGCFRMHTQPKQEMHLPGPPSWDDEVVWDEDPAEVETPQVRVVGVDEDEWSVV